MHLNFIRVIINQRAAINNIVKRNHARGIFAHRHRRNRLVVRGARTRLVAQLNSDREELQRCVTCVPRAQYLPLSSAGTSDRDRFYVRKSERKVNRYGANQSERLTAGSKLSDSVLISWPFFLFFDLFVAVEVICFEEYA